jgi:hypothetical protein
MARKQNRREWLVASATAAVTAALFPGRSPAEGAADGGTEAKLWSAQADKARAALAFWQQFLALRRGPNNDQPLDDSCRDRFLCVIRAVSWVESKHGTAGSHQPARDPMQCGNPADHWWQQLTGQTASSDRFVGGPGAGNYYAKELPDKAKDQPGFPADARLTQLADKTKGHNDANFNAAMSYVWGVVYLLHRINTHPDLGADRRTYKCGDCAVARMKKGAVAYNGGGDPMYGQKIDEAYAIIKS